MAAPERQAHGTEHTRPVRPVRRARPHDRPQPRVAEQARVPQRAVGAARAPKVPHRRRLPRLPAAVDQDRGEGGQVDRDRPRGGPPRRARGLPGQAVQAHLPLAAHLRDRQARLVHDRKWKFLF